MHTMMTAALAGLVLLSASPGQAEVGGRQVDLVARDGVKLKATYLAATRPGPGVLLLHQCGDGGRRSWDSLATLLAARGFHVLALDYRGFGESGDERFETATRDVRRTQLAKWAGDFDAAFEYLTAQPAVDSKRVAAAGASCGVENSVQLAVRHPEVKALILLSGSPDQAGLDHIRSAELPIFAASSEDDYGFVPYMRWLIRFSGHPGKKLVEYKNAGHGTDIVPRGEGPRADDRRLADREPGQHAGRPEHRHDEGREARPYAGVLVRSDGARRHDTGSPAPESREEA